VQGLKMASRNASDAQGLIDTAEGALQESHNLLLRMRELAVQTANGTMSSDDMAATDAELGQLIEEVENTYSKLEADCRALLRVGPEVAIAHPICKPVLTKP